jgi:hypothetical protein
VKATEARSAQDAALDAPQRPVSPASFSVAGLHVPTAELIELVTIIVFLLIQSIFRQVVVWLMSNLVRFFAR